MEYDRGDGFRPGHGLSSQFQIPSPRTHAFQMQEKANEASRRFVIFLEGQGRGGPAGRAPSILDLPMVRKNAESGFGGGQKPNTNTTTGVGSPVEMLVGLGSNYHPKETDHLSVSKDGVRISAPVTSQQFGLKWNNGDGGPRWVKSPDAIGTNNLLDIMFEEKENQAQHLLMSYRRPGQQLMTEREIMHYLQGTFFHTSVPLTHCSTVEVGTPRGPHLRVGDWTADWPEKCQKARDLATKWPPETGTKVLTKAYEGLEKMDSERTELEMKCFQEQSREFPLYKNTAFTPQALESFIGSCNRQLELFMMFKRKAFMHYTDKLVADEKIAMERERARSSKVPPNVSDMDIAAAKNGVISGEWGRVPAPPPPPPPRAVGKLPMDMAVFRYECTWVMNVWLRRIIAMSKYLMSSDNWHNIDELLTGITNLMSIHGDVRNYTFQIYERCYCKEKSSSNANTRRSGTGKYGSARQP